MIVLRKLNSWAEDILSDAEFAEILAEMDSMAEESLAGGKGSGGNTKGTRKVINQYGEKPYPVIKILTLVLRIVLKESLSGMVILKTSIT